MSSGTEDALLALRNAIKSQSTISHTANGEPASSLAAATHLVLSSQTLPKSTPTRFRKPGTSGSDPSTSPGDFFTLDAIYVTWLLKDASVTEYMKQARDNGLTGGLVSVTERKSVVDWLEGKLANHPSVVPLPCEWRRGLLLHPGLTQLQPSRQRLQERLLPVHQHFHPQARLNSRRPIHLLQPQSEDM